MNSCSLTDTLLIWMEIMTLVDLQISHHLFGKWKQNQYSFFFFTMASGSVSCSSEVVKWRAFIGPWYTGRDFTVMNQTSLEIWSITYMQCNIQHGCILNEHCWVSRRIQTRFLLQLTWFDIPDGFASSPPHATCSLETICVASWEEGHWLLQRTATNLESVSSLPDGAPACS